MTTIAYDGECLAVDSKQTMVSDGFKTSHCPHCSKIVGKLISYEPKIEASPRTHAGPMFCVGEMVKAWAWAGSKSTTEQIKQWIETGAIPLTTTGLANGTLVVLTTEPQPIEIRVQDGAVTVQRIAEKTYAAGSGRKAALVAMKHVGAGAVKAVTIAAEVDESTGGDVYSVNRTDYKLRKNGAPHEE